LVYAVGLVTSLCSARVCYVRNDNDLRSNPSTRKEHGEEGEVSIWNFLTNRKGVFS